MGPVTNLLLASQVALGPFVSADDSAVYVGHRWDCFGHVGGPRRKAHVAFGDGAYVFAGVTELRDFKPHHPAITRRNLPPKFTVAHSAAAWWLNWSSLIAQNPFTVTDTELSVLVPLPSWPLSLSPQHCTEP